MPPDTPATDTAATNDPTGRPFSDLRDTGLLWLINRVILHPRGYVLGLCYDGDTPVTEGGTVTGWTLYGDGSEPWTMGDPTPEQQALGYKTEHQLFALIKALLP
jgi:hypothetical protein